MRKIFCYVLLVVLFAPSAVFAACTEKGATVIYVNGIFTDKQQAQLDVENLGDLFVQKTKDQTVRFYNGYNPSHLAGLGDLVQSIAQIMGASVSGFDLNTILLQIHPQVTTRKLLLVGHSQGSFYANAMYDYLLAHGEPKAAVGVYAVGTPASYVAGGGKHLNSTADALLDTVDSVAGKSPLSRNITLPIADADKASKWPGHGLSRAYLAQGADRVVGDIKKEIDALKPVQASDTGECFTAPNAGLGYQVSKVGFAVADATSQGVKTGLGVAQAAGVALGDAFLAAAGGAWGLGQKVVADVGITVGGISGLSKAATDEVRPTNFNIVQRLYGSSLTKEDIKELLGDQGSAIASADFFEEPFVAQEPVQEPEATSTPKTIYLSGSSGSSGDDTDTATSSQPNTATTTDPVASSTPPAESALLGELVINEVAWAGTYFDPAAQWVELYNASSSDINLASTSLAVGDEDPVALSGTIESHDYMVVQRVAGSIQGVNSSKLITANFFLLTSEPVQILLIDTDGKTIDATPDVDACGGSWCAGIAPSHGYADRVGGPKPVSMERVDMDEDGDDPSNWASNDGYTRVGQDSDNQIIIGTPGATNSKHWPMAGFFCGDEGEILTPSYDSEPYDPEGSQCTALYGGVQFDRFVGGAIYKGEVGSSTEINPFSFPARFVGGTAKVGTASFSPPEPGEYFVALWEYNNSVGSGFNTPRTFELQHYLLTGAQSGEPLGSPPLSFSKIPFTIEQ